MVGLAGVGTDAVAMQALASYGRDNDARDDGGETQSDDDDLLLLGATPGTVRTASPHQAGLGTGK